jgi:hypothetical protein
MLDVGYWILEDSFTLRRGDPLRRSEKYFLWSLR